MPLITYLIAAAQSNSEWGYSMTKKAVIIVISILLVALAVTGIAFAAWSVMEDDGVFTFTASSLELDISSDDLKMDTHALEPNAPVTARFKIRVQGEKSTVRFTQSVIKYNGGADGAMIDIPSRILDLTLPNTIYGLGGGDEAETVDCAVTLAFSKSSMDPHFMNRKISFTITATAEKFTEPVAHNITYIDGGEHANPAQYTAATNHTLTDPSPRDGYEFVGWYTDQDFANRITDILQANTAEQEAAMTDNTLYAQWNVTNYIITYMDGENAIEGLEPGTYTVKSGATLAETAVKEGFTFVGWYDNAELSGDAITAIEVGAFGNITYYAKWTPTV